MNIIFVTRCYKPTNLQAIKDNLKEVFQGQTEHSYVQYLLVDMSYGQKEQAFYKLEDEHTKVNFIYNKQDYYNNSSIDQLANRLHEDQNSWLYVLDDDNLINKNFLNVFNDYKGEDVLVVDSNYLRFLTLPTAGRVIGAVDYCNYIVKLNVKKQIKLIQQGEKSYQTDGRFFLHLMQKQYKFKFTHQVVVKKDAFKRPLNVLNRNA